VLRSLLRKTTPRGGIDDEKGEEEVDSENFIRRNEEGVEEDLMLRD